MTTPPPDIHADAIDPLRYVVTFNLFAAVAGCIFFTLAAALTYAMFAPVVPSALMLPWAIGTSLLLTVWAIIDIVVLVRKPQAAERVAIWAPFSQFILVSTAIIVVSCVWLFMPYADGQVQLLMTIFITAFVPTQILASPENATVNAGGASVVLGSTALFFAFQESEYGGRIALFLFAYGSVMVLLAFVISRLIGNVLSARRKSDETALALEAALAEVAEERDAKTRFIAAASHDLGQPLQAANLFFSQHLRAKDAGQRENAADGVRRAFASAEQLLSHMLNHLRLEADAVDPQMAVVSVADTIKRNSALLTPLAEDAGIDLRTVPSHHYLFTDKALLDRALSNLIDNAIRHSGAKRLLVGARNSPSETLRLWVVDDGVGVGAADAKRIFDDYYRGSDSKARSSSGFGLGLSSVRRISELLGGRTGIEPRWRKGVAFYLELPATLPAGLPRRRNNP